MGVGSKSDGRKITSHFLESVYSVLVLDLISFQGHGGAWGWAVSATAARCQEELTDQFYPQRDSSSSDKRNISYIHTGQPEDGIHSAEPSQSSGTDVIQIDPGPLQ